MFGEAFADGDLLAGILIGTSRSRISLHFGVMSRLYRFRVHLSCKSIIRRPENVIFVLSLTIVHLHARNYVKKG